jgi:eukaryotic-like serine/threonine-protein kinase
MNGPAVGTDKPGTAEADAVLAKWVAEVVDRISVGESLDLDALAIDHPDGVARVRRVVPVMAIMSRLRAPSDAGAGHWPGDGPRTTSVEPGSDLGDFRTIRLIGRGGMGVVYEAVQISLNRRVALKILPMLSADNPRKLKRFQIEAQAAALLNDPHIVPVYLVGSENGVHFYAMQLIEGQTLADLISGLRDARESAAHPAAGELYHSRREHRRRPGEGEPPSEPTLALGSHGGSPSRSVSEAPTRSINPARPPARFAAELGRQAALALHHAHEQGIVHRDVKPSNLLVESSGWLWVADFGLARISGDGDRSSTGLLMGTPRYMSPEQVLGSRGVVDHRTDVYSLGATLYELITLRPAFDSFDRLETIVKIAQVEPRRPRDIDPAIPRDLETIVLKAMAKDPLTRYSTAGALAEDLGRFLDERPILARPPGMFDRAGKWARRHRPAVAATAVLVIASVFGLGGAILWRDGVIRRHNKELSSALVIAERNESSTRRLLYDSQMRLAQQASASGQVELAQELLEKLMPEPGERDLRGFEWHYLRRLCHRDVSVLTNHETMSMIVSPDGRTLVSGDGYGSLIIWDLATGRERKRFQGHPREVSGLMFSSDGETLASWSTVEGTPSEVKLWDPNSGRLVAGIPGIKGHVVSLAFSPDGRMLVIMELGANGDSSKNMAVQWDLGQGPAQPVPGAAPILCDKIAYSSDGRWLATGMFAGSTVTLRDAVTGQTMKTLLHRFPMIGGIVFSPDGNTVAVYSWGITFWDTCSGRELGSLPFPMARQAEFSPDGNRFAGVASTGEAIELIEDVRTDPRVIPLESSSGKNLHVAFSPDGKTLAGGGVNRSATLWDTTSGRKLAEFPGTTGSVECMVFAPGGQSLIFASQDGRVRSWHFDNRTEQVPQLAGHQKEVWALAYTPDGATLLSAGDDHLIKLWDSRNGRLQSTLKGHDALVTSLTVNHGGTLLASASFDKTVRLWELPSGKPGRVLRGHTDGARAVAFSPDAKTLASAGSDHTVRLWDLATGETISVIEGHTDSVRALVFDPGGSFLVSTGNDRTINVMAPSDGRKSFSLPCPKPNSSLAFSSDRTILATGDDWGNISLWNVATWTRQATIKGSDAPIWGLAFSPDGRTLAAACGDARVRLWDPISGQVVLVLDGHSQRVNAVVFSPDGQTLASADHKGEVKLWQAGPAGK